MTNAKLMQQLTPYLPWLVIGAVFVLFTLLRATRRGLRQRVDEIGYRLFGERGLFIWFWLNAPGVMLHEMSHAIAVLFFTPFGFRITSISFFHIKPVVQRDARGRAMHSGSRQSLQLGEVQYVRPQRGIMSRVGDGLSGVAPLFGGTIAFIFLYWVATGYSLWEIPLDSNILHLQLLRPGWPHWTLIFAPYLILTVTSELWPSSQDWKGARWFVCVFLIILAIALFAFWNFHHVSQADVISVSTFIAERINFALAILLALDLAFLLVAEMIVSMLRH